jgi:rubrerythrin
MSHRSFHELSSEEVMMVAIDIEEVNGARLRNFAELFADNSPDAAKVFATMAVEEDDHRTELEELYKQRYGEIRRTVGQDDVREVIEAHELAHGELQVFEGLSLRQALETVLAAELEAQAFYKRALTHTDDPDLQALFHKLGDFETEHVQSMETRLGALEKPA